MGTSALLLAADPVERYRAARIFSQCPRVELADGEAVDGTALPESKFLVVEEGTVQVARASRTTRRAAVVALASAGAVLLPPADDEHVAAVTPATLIAVAPSALTHLVAVPTIGEALCDALLDAVRERQEAVRHLHGATHPERLRETLSHLARAYGTVGQHGVEIKLPLTHELLARMTGSARETVTMTLSRFERDGLIVRDNGVYRLMLTPAELEAPPQT